MYHADSRTRNIRQNTVGTADIFFRKFFRIGTFCLNYIYTEPTCRILNKCDFMLMNIKSNHSAAVFHKFGNMRCLAARGGAQIHNRLTAVRIEY